MPYNSDRALLLVVSAPSGGGKTTLVNHLRKSIPQINYSISLTTRQARTGERDGTDYHFVSEQEFLKRKENGELAECAEVHGHWYGTLKSSIDQSLRNRQSIIFDIDVQGGKSIQALYPESILIFIAPPSFGVLEARLRARKQDDETTIQRRLKAVQKEIDQARQHYDYWIINDQLEKAAEKLRCVIIAESLRVEKSSKSQ